ncbi:MAG: hypothetical protein LDL23_12315 [Flavobacterium sp.]|uniref:hypothetical protein n=1 Tax=Flavobacterium sp. TaxID=239 RepID=UPI0025C6A293|nr:hypothetical protein [Flavobacterium sp.]MCA1967415.1 hypothetical protein [Flavobacterium sp.]
MLKKLPVTVQVLLISSVFFLIHFGIVTFLNKIDTTPFLMSYALQIIMTLVILLAMIKIYDTAKEQLGFAFLGLSTLKVGISYFFATEYLFQNKAMLETNKFNFFITFLFFLSLDVYFTIRLLNKK